MGKENWLGLSDGFTKITNKSKRQVRLGAGAHGLSIYVPQRFSAEFDFRMLPYIVSMEIAVTAGTATCTSFRCSVIKQDRWRRIESPAEVTSGHLRRVPVAKFVRWAVWMAAVQETDDWLPEEEFPEFIHGLEVALGEPQAYNWMTDDHLREVAQVYERALLTSGSSLPAPVKAISEKFHVSRATANRWVKAARDRGLLKKKGRR